MEMGITNERVKQLRKIQKAVTLARQVGGKPASGRAALIAGATMAAVQLGCYLLGSAFAVSFPWWVSFGAFGFVYGVELHRAPHKNYTTLIYELLTAYNPVNVRAYQMLQEGASKHGLQREAVEAWLSEEWAAVQPPSMPAEQSRFVNKKIGLHLVGKD